MTNVLFAVFLVSLALAGFAVGCFAGYKLGDARELELAFRIACQRLAQGSNQDGSASNIALWQSEAEILELELLEEAALELSLVNSNAEKV